MQSQHMRRRVVVALTITGLALTISACSSGDDSSGGGGGGEVLVYDGGGAWGEAQRQAYFEPFEEETGITVVPVPADLPAAMRTTVEAGSPSMDVMDLTPFDIAAWGEAGLLQPIDSDAWTDVDVADFEPYQVEEFGVPSLVYATQMAWDESATNGPLESWADFWDTGAFPGERTMGDGTFISTGVFEAALLADGVAKEDLYPLDIDRAFAKLDEIRPEILKFWGTGAESVQLLADGQVSATAAWNGRVAALQDEMDTVSSTWNDAILTVDFWAVPEGAANSENAQKFIEFASRPDRQAEFADLVTYSPTNSKAYDDISAERQELLPTSPDHLEDVVVASLEFWNSDSGDGRPWSVAIVDRWQNWLSN